MQLPGSVPTAYAYRNQWRLRQLTHLHLQHLFWLVSFAYPLLRRVLLRSLEQMDLAERVVSLARGRYDDATALVVVFE